MYNERHAQVQTPKHCKCTPTAPQFKQVLTGDCPSVHSQSSAATHRVSLIVRYVLSFGELFKGVLLIYLRQQIVRPSAKRVTTKQERSTLGRAERVNWRPLRPCNGGTREARRGHFLMDFKKKV